MTALAAAPFDEVSLSDGLDDDFGLGSIGFIAGESVGKAERSSLDKVKTTIFLFFADLFDCVGGVAGGMDTFDSELGIRRKPGVPLGGPGILVSGLRMVSRCFDVADLFFCSVICLVFFQGGDGMKSRSTDGVWGWW